MLARRDESEQSNSTRLLGVRVLRCTARSITRGTQMKYKALLAATVAALMSTSANAGVFILDGTDSDDHGFFSGTNQDGWFYIQRGLENIAASPDLTRTQNVIAVLGSNVGSTAANAVTSAVTNGGLSGTYSLVFLNDAAITGFFANTNPAGQNSTDASIIYIDSGTNVSGGISGAEQALLTANATAIDAFLGAGGGLFSHSHTYGWLTALIPGAASVNFSNTGLTLTPAGTANFPGLTNADLSSGPWHSYFTGFGAIPVLATGIGPGGAEVAVIIGGSGGTITQPPTSGVPEPATWAMMLMGFGFIGGAMRYSRRRTSVRFSAA